jgi:hypothetical protein
VGRHWKKAIPGQGKVTSTVAACAKPDCLWRQSHSVSETLRDACESACPELILNQRYYDNGVAKMFDVAIFCVIFIAIAYSAFLWRMGRRDDVLHGEFILQSSSLQSSSLQSSSLQSSSPSPSSTLDIEASLKSLLQAIDRDLFEGRN